MAEKTLVAHTEQTQHEPFSRHQEQIESHNGEVLLTVEPKGEDGSIVTDLKLAKDGRTILVPQPSDDPDDPLNWSSFKKHGVLILVSLGTFLGDFGACAGIPTVVVQGIEWNQSPVVVNYANNLAAIMCGVSGLIWMPLLNYWGRMPVLFWSTFLGLFFSLGCTLSQSFETFYAMRGLQCLCQSAGQTIGLAFVEDMFFFHDHAKKIGIWYAFFISAPFWSPFFGNYMIAGLGEWRPMFWIVVAMAVSLLGLILVFGDEPYYNRSVPADRQPVRDKGTPARLTRVIGLWQIRNHKNYFATLTRSYGRLLEMLLKPVILLSMFFYSIIFMWSIGINVSSAILLELPIAQGGYGMSPTGVGTMFLTPIVAVFIGEAFGHYFNDYIAMRHTKKHHGLFVPEARLYTTYIGGVLMIPGLILVGQTLQHHLHWVGIIFGWGLFQVGVMLVSVATAAYVLDCYTSASGEVSALLNFGRVGTGFTVAYFQLPWGLKQGFDVSFGLQAVVAVFAFIIIIATQLTGAKLRHWAGPARPLEIKTT